MSSDHLLGLRVVPTAIGRNNSVSFHRSPCVRFVLMDQGISFQQIANNSVILRIFICSYNMSKPYSTIFRQFDVPKGFSTKESQLGSFCHSPSNRNRDSNFPGFKSNEILQVPLVSC